MSTNRAVRRFHSAGEPEVHENVGTVLSLGPLHPNRADARAMFLDHWNVLDAAARRYTQPGVVFLLVDMVGQRPLAELWLSLEADGPQVGILGRHSMAELHVPGSHGDVALRQLALIARRDAAGRAELRVIDLRTGVSPLDERGRALEGALTGAPLFLRVHGVGLVGLETPVGDAWADRPLHALGRLPARRFVDVARPSEVVAPRPLAVAHGGAQGETLVRSFPGASSLGMARLDPGETAVGRVHLEVGRAEVNYPVSERLLERGLLVGRYERCQLALGGEVPSLSRVHLLVVRVGDELLAIDTASTNGIEHAGRRARVVSLVGHTRVALSSDVALTWTSVD